MKLLLECLIVLIPEWLARSNHSSNQTIRQSCNLLNFHFSIINLPGEEAAEGLLDDADPYDLNVVFVLFEVAEVVF